MLALQVYQYTTVRLRLYGTPSSHVRTLSSGSDTSSLSIELKFQHISSIYVLLGFISVHVSDIKSDYSSHRKSHISTLHTCVRRRFAHTGTHTHTQRLTETERKRESNAKFDRQYTHSHFPARRRKKLQVFIVPSRMIRETAGQEERTHPSDPCARDRIPQSSREGNQDGAVQKQRQILSVVPVQLTSCQSLPAENEV